MRLYIIIAIVIILAIGIYLYMNWDKPTEKLSGDKKKNKKSLKDKLKNMSADKFKKKYPELDKKTFIEIRNLLKNDPDNVTEEYLKNLLGE